MDWDRNRRFDDHRGGESYRPANRGYIRRSRSPRNRSPRRLADTWVPSSNRTYNRLRSRSPPSFRRRSSRSPPYYGRDVGLPSYNKTCSSPRRFSPRRERAPVHTSWRPRSPYTDGRSRDFSRGRTAFSRSREMTPTSQDARTDKRDRSLIPSSEQFPRSNSRPRRGSLRENLPRAPVSFRSRSPLHERRDRYLEDNRFQKRRSLSPRSTFSKHTSAPGSGSNSRRSSPFTDRPPASDPRGRSPAAHSTSRQQLTRNLRNSPTRQDTTPSLGKDESRDGTPIPRQDPAMSTNRGSDLDKTDRSDSSDLYGKNPSQTNATRFHSHAKTPHSALQSQSPPSGPSHGAKTSSSQNRGSSISLLSAPTRPRGGASFKELNTFAGPTVRRGPLTPHANMPPSGPRTNHVPTGPSAEIHRPHAYRQNSLTAPSYPRTPKYTSHLAGLCSIIPGGRLLPSALEPTMEKRLSQLDVDKMRLFEQITESQRLKRTGVRDWDKLDRESSICALKSELAEGHLQCITDSESMHGAAIF
ncbi:hypothetical protein P170DRAFT_394366 [Aspergillus steynii IBT 23096]|uniref:Serine/arginine repetitive matrix protein 1 n=1 Tax=Aspergillus steynii IBT 23096 TaxID=1392250 RepID=A0A2I2FR51_9EURO|nr:uncharacterized protein P170DRAFT_394366 [Aspergillus steynii IBT 23096]PLB43087.1 hypothetical protein P170DRAFT_394366 [Aspergillus steynii IBT 23096]